MNCANYTLLMRSFAGAIQSAAPKVRAKVRLKIAVGLSFFALLNVWYEIPSFALPAQNVAQQQFELGLGLQQRRQYRQAINYFDRAISADSKHAAAYASRAACLMQIDNYEDAMKDVNKAIALDPKMAIAYADRAKIYNEQNNRKQAISDFTTAIDLSKTNPDVEFFRDRGCLYKEAGDDDKAVADFSAGLLIRPKDPWLHYFRACIEFKKTKYKEAIEDATASINSKTPEKGSFYRLRAKCYVKVGQPQLAKKDRDTALSTADSEWGELLPDTVPRTKR